MYQKFKKIDGRHPWREVSPDGYIDYQARYRPNGRVLYFNFALAREMELLSADHPPTMNKDLEQAILETFSLRIINEYDREQGRKYPAETIKPNPYMATRYLQTQHQNRQGKTSGDGRSIWNGFIRNGKLTFDISSRGTGATCLSPGAQHANGIVKTGDESYGYSSGLADLEEMLGSALMSEIFQRQVENGFWEIPPEPHAGYEKALDYVARAYGKMAAVLEEEYIFNWLAWDGDNLLASGAILDYGSIRQFAAKHDKYRFKDVDRYSASLREQRGCARMIVQVFAQALDFARTGVKQNLNEFKNAECLKRFDLTFEAERDRRMLWRIGFTSAQIEHVMAVGQKEIREFHRSLSYFEDRKVSKGIEKLPDGFT